MKWIEPGEGAIGPRINLENMKSFAKYSNDKKELFIGFDVGMDSETSWEYKNKDSRDADYERIRKIAMGEDLMNESEPDPIQQIDPLEQKRQKFHNMVLVQIGKRIKVHFHPGTEVPYYEFENDDLRRVFDEICRIPMIKEWGK